jgi:signal transduction histidine kinase
MSERGQGVAQEVDHACDGMMRRGVPQLQTRHADQRRLLSQRLVEVREDERRRLAQELHDRVGQNLTALDLNLSVICGALPHNASSKVHERLSECLRLVGETVEIVSNVMAELRPVVPAHAGLLVAVRWHAEQFRRRTGVPVTVIGSEPAWRLSTVEQDALMRIAQEALTNAAKHARGAQVSLTLQSSAVYVRMIVADNGCGFDASLRTLGEGCGLRIMRERAAAVGATLQVESRVGIGSQVIVDVRR